MKAYLIVDLTVEDPDRYQEYVKQAPAFVARHGGKYLVRGGEVDVVEGDWTPTRVVVLEFPDKAHLDGLVNDARYQEVANIRRAATVTQMIAVEGCEPPPIG